MTYEFKPFPKVPRLSRDVVITEKLDGTNASIHFIPKAEFEYEPDDGVDLVWGPDGVAYVMFVGSRNQYITPAKDNFGFAKWAYEHAEELAALGVGSHYGEWWGPGIQRGYGIREKRFSLFNVNRWLPKQASVNADTYEQIKAYFTKAVEVPGCCDVVPVAAVCDFNTENIAEVMLALQNNGSLASPGFMRPEGIMIYHTAAGQYFKKTFEKDEKGKGE